MSLRVSRWSFVGLLVLVLAVSGASQWWAGRHQAALGAQLAALARPGDIRMVSSLTCSYCAAARQWMESHGVSFGECFIENDAECASLYRAARAPGTPLMVLRGGGTMLGFDARRLRDALAPAGG
jgi:glutaredoxin